MEATGQRMAGLGQSGKATSELWRRKEDSGHPGITGCLLWPTAQRARCFLLALEPTLCQKHFLINTVKKINHILDPEPTKKDQRRERATGVSNFLYNPLMRLVPS